MATRSVTSGKDTGVGILTARYSSGDYEKFTALRYVTKVMLCSGLSPSYAFLSHPMKGWGPGAYDEQMPCIAMQNDGPLKNILLLSRMVASYTEPVSSGGSGQSVDLLAGSVVRHSHDLGQDNALTEFWDDRFVLGKYTVKGCLVYDPQQRRTYYDMTRPAIYNNFGVGDCLDTFGGPMHAPCFRCGYKDSDQSADYVEVSDGAARAKARTWTVADVIENLRMRHAAEMFFPPKVDVGTYRLPPFIRWPSGLGQIIKNGRRPLKSINLQGQSLLMALQRLARYAGVYDIYMEPDGDFGSVLELLDMSGNPTYDSFTKLYMTDMPGASLPDFMSSGSVIDDGYMTESFINGFHDTTIEGDGPAMESMVSTLDDDGDVEFALSPAWFDDDKSQDSAIHTAATNFIDQNGDDQDAFELAKEKWPTWLCGYRIKLGFNPWRNSKWAGLNNGGRVRIKPFICTGFQMNANNPRDWQPRDIVCEYRIDPNTETGVSAPPKWYRGYRYDNLTLNPDSTIVMLSNLRDQLQNWYQDTSPNAILDTHGVPKFGLNIHPREIRINLAMEADWPIVGRGVGDPNNTAARVDYTYQYTWGVSSEPMSYVELLRSAKAWPEGKAILPDKCTYPEHQRGGSELWSDLRSGLLLGHARDVRLPEVNRVENNAKLRIGIINPAMRPGLAVQVIGKKSLVNKGVLKSVEFSMEGTNRSNPEDKAPDTWIEVGAPDWAPRMDIHNQAPTTSGSGAPMTSINEKYQPQTDMTGKTPADSYSTDRMEKVFRDNMPDASEETGYEGPTLGSSEDSDGPTIGPRRDAGVAASAPRDAVPPGDEGGTGGAGAPGNRGSYAPQPYSGKDYPLKPLSGKGTQRMLSPEDIKSENRYAEQDMAASYDRTSRSPVAEVSGNERPYKSPGRARPLTPPKPLSNPETIRYNSSEEQAAKDQKLGEGGNK